MESAVKIHPDRIASLIRKAREGATYELESACINAIVEFYPIVTNHDDKKRKVIFPTTIGQEKHKYRSGLKKELEEHSGVYIFFDSAGKAIYVGKAKDQNLWREMNLAYNRSRAQQSIRLVGHPTRNQSYLTCQEKERQICSTSIKLHHMAAYFSAYYVSYGMIDAVESLLIRSFANNILNIKMERSAARRR